MTDEITLAEQHAAAKKYADRKRLRQAICRGEVENPNPRPRPAPVPYVPPPRVEVRTETNSGGWLFPFLIGSIIGGGCD